MDITTFDQALDFAIGREREAIAFYERLLGHSAFAAQHSMLAELRAMEEGHARALEAMRTRGLPPLKASEALRSSLAAFLEDRDSGENPDYQAVVRSAIKKEGRSEALYQALADASGDSALANAFTGLAQEEAKHRQFFETLYATDIARDN